MISTDIVRLKRRKNQPEELGMAIKGSRGTSISFHEGNTPKICIVEAAGSNAADMSVDMIEVVNAQQGYCYSDIPPTVNVQVRPGRIYVIGEGGNAKTIVSAMVDAVLLQKKEAETELAV